MAMSTKIPPISHQLQRGRLIPRIVTDFNENDVFMGNYSLVPTEFHHNECFRELLFARRKDFLRASSRRSKHRVCKAIIKTVHDRGGRFLELMMAADNNGNWRIEDTAAILNKKIRHFMRDVGPDTRKKRILRRMEVTTTKSSTNNTSDASTSSNMSSSSGNDSDRSVATQLSCSALASHNKNIMNNNKKIDKASSSPAQAAFHEEQVTLDQVPPSLMSLDSQSSTSSEEDGSNNLADFAQGLVSGANDDHQVLTMLLGRARVQEPPPPPQPPQGYPRAPPRPAYMPLPGYETRSPPPPPPPPPQQATAQPNVLLGQLLSVLGSQQPDLQTLVELQQVHPHFASNHRNAAAMMALSSLLSGSMGRWLCSHTR